jgi:outer membrane protein assembly factor BamA
MSPQASCRALLWICLIGLVGGGVRAAGAQPAAVPPSDWSRYNGWEIQGFEVTGLPPGLAGEATGGLRLQGQWKPLRGRSRPAFQANLLRDDVRRLRLYLARRGYPVSRVEVRIAAERRSRSLRLQVAVEPGPPVLVRAVRFRDWPGSVAMPDSVEVRRPTAGRPLVDAEAAALRRHLRTWLQDAGYADARVEVALAAAGPGQVILDVLVTPGEYYTISAVEIEGCAADLEPVARRTLAIAAGTPYGASLLADAAAALRATQLFGQVELVTRRVAPGDLVLTASLTDARMRSWRASVGTWTDNPWMARAGWTDRNLLGGGRGLDVHGTYATHEQDLGVELFWLGWLAPRARSSVGGRWLREDEEAYLSREYRLDFVQAFQQQRRAATIVGVGVSAIAVDTRSPDVEDIPEEQDWLLESWVERKWDWTDDLLYPTRGGYLTVAATLAPPSSMWDNPYFKLQLDGTVYRSVGGPFVTTARVRGGWSRPLGDRDDLLANRRFYAGGYNTMRGTARRDLGPRDSAGQPRGGQVVLLGGAEVRSRVVWILDAAVFLDAGQVWERPGDVTLGALAAAAGVDLDLRTPLGPLRVGHAWNLTTTPAGETSTLWHFGIGYPW